MTDGPPSTAQVAALHVALERRFEAERNLPIEPSAWEAGFRPSGPPTTRPNELE